MSKPPVLEFDGASLGYGGRAVLKGVDLRVHSGDFLGILGHNGSGKTTLLKTWLGLIPPLGGRMKVLSRDGGPPRFGYVPQKEKLDPIYPLSGYEVASMGACRELRLGRTLRGRREKDVLQALRDCGAQALADRRYSDLSGGQKQRVLIARALAADPEILALDEPLAGIDISTQQAILALLRELKETRGLTMLMVSHRVQSERGLFSHIAWVENGAVVSGAAESMLSKGRIAEIFKSEL